MSEQLAVFIWTEARPDNREFRQNSSMLVPENFKIGIYIPRKSEYIYNIEEILQAELGTGNAVVIPDPVYTPKAIQYCLDKLGEYLKDHKVTPEDFDLDDDDWDNGDKKEEKSSDDDEWLDGADTDDNKEEDWDENEEEWN